MNRIDDQLKQIANLDKGKPRKSVTVLGAGMAGLSAAYELSKLGHHVSIIEATSRVGGRVRTHRFKSGQYGELGAMRIPASHDYTRHYIDLTGLKDALRPFITGNKNPNCFYRLRGHTFRIKDMRRFMHLYDLSALERKVVSSAVPPALLGMHFENTLAQLSEIDRDSMFGSRVLTDNVAQLESQSLGEYLDRRVEGDDARELIGATTGLEVWWEKAASQFLRDEIVDTSTGLQEISGGMDRLPNELADLLGRDKIIFNMAVVLIEVQDHGVALGLMKTDPSKWDCPVAGGDINRVKAEFVICSLPFPVLRRIDVRGLSHRKKRAIRDLSYASSTKVLLHCKERFWESGPPADRIIGGASFSDDIIRSTYYPSDHASPSVAKLTERRSREGSRSIFSAHGSTDVQIAPSEVRDSPGPGVLLGSYNWGPDARRLGGMPPGDRAETVIACVEKFHPKIRTFVDESPASMYWDDFRWSGAAFCFMQPGDLKGYYQDAIQSEGPIHFAGEHCSLDQGWQQGAIISGLRAVEEIVSI
jgi:monoamine oxidase